MRRRSLVSAGGCDHGAALHDLQLIDEGLEHAMGINMPWHVVQYKIRILAMAALTRGMLQIGQAASDGSPRTRDSVLILFRKVDAWQ